MIYYLRRSDGLIKIGTSRQVNKRAISLRGEHGPLALLLAHEGGHQREHRLHGVFDHLWAEGEWFHPEPVLLDWIERIKRRNVDLGREVLTADDAICRLMLREIIAEVRAARKRAS